DVRSMYVTWTVDLKNGSRAQERTYLLDRQTNSPTTVSFLNIPCQGSDYSVNLPIEADVQERSIHLGQVNSFTEVLRSILQEVLRSNSPAKRTKAEKLSQRGSIISAKRTNMDEDILTKAQRLAAKHNLEIKKILVFLATTGLPAPRRVATAPTRHSPTSLTPPPPY
ncbi:hypothetical protein ACJX0J_017073, partial [Zea mays]